MRKTFFLISVLAILLTSCESNYEKLLKKGSKEYEECIEAFNNAQSIKEVRQIKKDFYRRADSWEKELEKFELEISITEKQKFMQDEYYNSLEKRLKEAERNAYERLRFEEEYDKAFNY